MPRKKISQELAKPGDPLVTSDGVTLMPHANPIGDQPPVQRMTPQNFRPTTRRGIRELPAPIPIMNAIGAVFLYSMMGLGDREICDALKITQSQLVEIRNHDGYGFYFNIVLGEFINANSGLLQSRLAGYADAAITTVGTLAKEAKHESTKLKAADSILDRVGMSSKEQKQNAGMSANELRIVIVDSNQRGVELELNGERMP